MWRKIAPKMSDALTTVTVFIQSLGFLRLKMEGIASAQPFFFLQNGGRKADLVGTEFVAFKDTQRWDDDCRGRDKKAFVGERQRVSVLSSEVWLEKRSVIYSVRITAEASYLVLLTWMSHHSHTLIWDGEGIAAASRFGLPQNVIRAHPPQDHSACCCMLFK